MPKKTLQILKKTKNDAIIRVKGNQNFLLKDCEKIAKETKLKEKKRVAELFTDVSLFSESIKKQCGAYVRALIKVTRTTKSLNTKTKRSDSFEEAFYISTNAIISASDANQLIRLHWGIQSKNHYVRDGTFQEDDSRIRRNPDRMVRLRSFALNILRANDVDHINRTRFKNGCSIDNMLKYKGI